MEIHKKMQNDVPVLDAEGKICALTSTKYLQPSLYPKSDLKCTECNNQFATQKSLTTHMKVSFFLVSQKYGHKQGFSVGTQSEPDFVCLSHL